MSEQNGQGMVSRDAMGQPKRVLDKHVLQQAKEIMLDLWMKGRVDMYVRSEADIALSAAIFALDTPDCGKVTKRMGAIANNAQWKAEQEAKNREF